MTKTKNAMTSLTLSFGLFFTVYSGILSETAHAQFDESKKDVPTSNEVLITNVDDEQPTTLITTTSTEQPMEQPSYDPAIAETKIMPTKGGEDKERAPNERINNNLNDEAISEIGNPLPFEEGNYIDDTEKSENSLLLIYIGIIVVIFASILTFTASKKK